LGAPQLVTLLAAPPASFGQLSVSCRGLRFASLAIASPGFRSASLTCQQSSIVLSHADVVAALVTDIGGGGKFSVAELQTTNVLGPNATEFFNDRLIIAADPRLTLTGTVQ